MLLKPDVQGGDLAECVLSGPAGKSKFWKLLLVGKLGSFIDIYIYGGFLKIGFYGEREREREIYIFIYMYIGFAQKGTPHSKDSSS